jgi:hypothetical protein
VKTVSQTSCLAVNQKNIKTDGSFSIYIFDDDAEKYAYFTKLGTKTTNSG